MRLGLFAYRVATQSWNDTHAMIIAQNSICDILFPAFRQRYFDYETLVSITDSLRQGDYHRALWDLMDALEHDRIIEENEKLRLHLEESWKLVSDYQQCRVHHYERLEKEAKFNGTQAEEPMDKLLNDEKGAMELCMLGMNRMSKYQDGATQVSWQKREQADSLKIKVD